jgi:glycosyltransferase involved in cell wall biosynthesis
LWLYPTRAIRRKNLGELLFWSALGEKNDLFATTQAPLNPAERPVYERWKGLANELSLPMAFELGMDFKGDFLHLLKSAHSLLSTSITEGFGLAFLEPWLVERPLVGRNLPEITADFGALGIDLDPLYTRLPAPLAWLDSEQLKKRIASGLKRAFEAYGRQVRDSDQQRAWAAFVHNDEVDFGRLDEPLQEIVLRRLVAAKNSGERPGIAPLTTAAASGLIEKNRRIIDDQLSLERYAQRLMDAYTRLLEAPCSPIGGADGPALLDAFLAPERLFLLKT